MMSAAWASEAAAGSAAAFYEEPTFWVMIAFVIFVGAIAKPFWRFVTTSLDKRSRTIAEQIAESSRLRDEAQELLASFKRKQRKAESEAEEIAKRARAEADRQGEQATADLEKSIKRRQQMALDRIAQAEAEAVDEVRAQAIDVALDATRRILADTVKGKKADTLIDAAIEELPDKLH